VTLAIVVVLAIANAGSIAAWLEHVGVIGFAQHLRREYLTGTAITVIAVLLFLLAGPVRVSADWFRRCRVCRRVYFGQAKYCGKCGSRM